MLNRDSLPSTLLNYETQILIKQGLPLITHKKSMENEAEHSK